MHLLGAFPSKSENISILGASCPVPVAPIKQAVLHPLRFHAFALIYPHHIIGVYPCQAHSDPYPHILLHCIDSFVFSFVP